jgi:hypothetical protein
MSKSMYKTQIVLEPEQHKALAEIAEREGRSVADVVREMVGQQLEQRKIAQEADKQRWLAGLEQVRAFREELLQERNGEPIDFDVVEAINQMREERDERNLGILTGSGD